MHPLLRRIERVVDDLIWPALIALLAIITLEVGFHDVAVQFYPEIHAADVLIISIFVVDLGFKWNRTRKVKPFLKKYWLDILAVFPFFLLFRAFEGISALFGAALDVGETTQKVVHSGLELEREGAQVIREVEAGVKEASKASRGTRFARFIRPIFRLPRFAKAAHFYEKP